MYLLLQVEEHKAVDVTPDSFEASVARAPAAGQLRPASTLGMSFAPWQVAAIPSHTLSEGQRQNVVWLSSLAWETLQSVISISNDGSRRRTCKAVKSPWLGLAVGYIALTPPAIIWEAL